MTEAFFSGFSQVFFGAAFWGFILGKFALKQWQLDRKIALTCLLAGLLGGHAYLTAESSDARLGAILGSAVLIGICLPFYFRNRHNA